MKERFRKMSERIPNDIGQIVDRVYQRLELGENDSVKRLPLEENSSYLSPLREAAIEYHGLEENVAQKRVIDSIADKYHHYMTNTSLNRDARIYMTICATADQYGPDDDDTDVVTGNLFGNDV